MKSIHLSLSLIATLAIACARPPEPTEGRRVEETAGVAPGAAPTPAGAPAMTIIGVHPESAIAVACDMTLPPAAFFEFDSAALEAAGARGLQEVATCLSTGPLTGRKVELVGHTDPRGDDEYNRQLGRSRAQAVQEFLQQRGVAPENIVVRSMGDALAQAGEPGQWPLERRVDIRLLP